jgi:hypothetical protein
LRGIRVQTVTGYHFDTVRFPIDRMVMVGHNELTVFRAADATTPLCDVTHCRALYARLIFTVGLDSVPLHH